MTYIMIWKDETEKWFYFRNSFNADQFKNGYVDYYIEVENGYIISDTWEESNKGKKFDECYDLMRWEK